MSAHDPLPDSKPDRGWPDEAAMREVVVVGWLLAGAAVLNFLMMPALLSVERARLDGASAIVLVAAAVGLLGAQLPVATLWIVWGSWPFLCRLVLHWAAGGGLFVAWAIGLAAALSDGPNHRLLVALP